MKNITSAIHYDSVYMNDSHSEAIAMTSAYDFDSAEQASARFLGESPGNVYSRFTNPTVELFEQKISALEGGESAVGLASGMAAYLAVAMTFLKEGDHVLLASGIFGTTTHLFRQYFGAFGVSATSVPVDDVSQWEQCIKPNTRLFLVESPTNPMLRIADISVLSQLAKQNNALLVVDNTLLTPIFQKPIALGADIVLHSAGKFLDGQGRCVGGALIGRQELIKPVKQYLRSTGICMSPFNAWVFSKGIETLQARMLMHERNSKALYEWLRLENNISNLITTISESHPNKNVINKQQTGHCPILSFEINGNKEEAWKFINSLKLVKRCTNIGDAQTLITHPASTTHCRYTQAEKDVLGITDTLVRVCVGLEDPDDIIDDISQGIYIAKKNKHLTQKVFV